MALAQIAAFQIFVIFHVVPRAIQMAKHKIGRHAGFKKRSNTAIPFFTA